MDFDFHVSDFQIKDETIDSSWSSSTFGFLRFFAGVKSVLSILEFLKYQILIDYYSLQVWFRLQRTSFPGPEL